MARERIVSKALPVAKRRRGRLPARKIRLYTTSGKNRIAAMPGISEQTIGSILPAKWRRVETYAASRAKRGPLIRTAEVFIGGKKTKIFIRPIRGHYALTHEARMLLHLKAKGYAVEEPLALMIDQNGTRWIITREITGEQSIHATGAMLQAIEKRLRKEERIVADDLYQYGKPNYKIVSGPNREPILVLFDVEHYYSTDRKSPLYKKRMLRRKYR